MIIGIEGPAGAGKTTMARTVAAEIDAVVIEGGVWYRALTHEALERDVDLGDTQALIGLAEELNITAVSDDGRTRILIDGIDVTDQLYGADVDRTVAAVAQQLPVRAVIEPKIVAAVRAQDTVIIVGRHLRKALPEAAILRLTIAEEEVERRHRLRSSAADRLVADRNARDAVTAQLLGAPADGIFEVDVTVMTPTEQADTLREFIDTIRVNQAT